MFRSKGFSQGRAGSRRKVLETSTDLRRLNRYRCSERGFQTEVAGESETNMTIQDMSQYAGTDYIKFKDLQANGPREEVIADCVPGNFDQPDRLKTA